MNRIAPKVTNFDPNGNVTFAENVTINSLSGTGDRMVVSNSEGILSTQAIPGGGGGGGTGTVTSVSLTAPTGFSVNGSPITTSGTLGLTFASGYSLPTTAKQSNWDDSYTFVSNFPTVSGNGGKFLTTDGEVLSWGVVTASVSDGDKGDIVVSESGTSWNLDTGVVDIANLSATGTPSSSTYLRGDNTWATVSGGGGGGGYTLQAAAISTANFTWADNATYYFGIAHTFQLASVQGRGEIFIPKTGTIKKVFVYASFSTAGSAESWTMSVLVNGTSATTIQSISVNTATRSWSNTNMSVSVTEGDHIEIRSSNPNWATNPASSAGYGINAVIYIE